MKIRRELGVPRLGLGFRAWDGDALRSAAVRSVGNGVPAGAPRAEAVNASAWVRTKRDQTLRPQVQRKKRSTPTAGPVPDDWSDQTPMRLAGARRLKDQRQTPTAGLDRGRRDSSTPPDPVRAACGELRQIRSGSIPSWETLPESESDPSGHTRATGIVPPRFLWSETLVKPNNAVIVAAFAAAKEALQHPLRQIPQSVNRNRHPAQLLPPPSKAE